MKNILNIILFILDIIHITIFLSDIKIFYKMIGSNVTFVKYVDETIFSDVCKVSNYVIYYESFIKSKNYTYIPLLLKRSLLVEDILWYRDFIVNSKKMLTYLRIMIVYI